MATQPPSLGPRRFGVSVLRRTATVVLVSGLAVPLWATPSSAATASEPAAMGAYFYAGGVTTEGLGLPVDPPAAPPNVTADNADGVSKGNLAVSASGGAEDKVSFLSFALSEVPLDSTIDSAVLTVPLVPGNPPSDIVYGAAPDRVRVCKAGDQGFFGEDGTTILLAPDRLCDEFSSKPGTLSKDGKAYVFDVTELAATWLEANDGLALTVTEEAMSSSFQVVFAPAEKATLAYTYTPPVEDAVTDVGTVDVPDAGTADLGGGFGGSTTTDTGSFDGGTVESPLVDTALPAEPAPAAAPAAPEVAAPVQVVPVAAASEVLRPTAAFWIGGLLLAAALALLSLILGDPRVPTATAKPSRLTQALQARERAPKAAPAAPLRTRAV